MSAPRCSCAERTARAAIVLLDIGRVHMALSLPRGLPDAIRQTVAAAHEAGVREGRKRPQPARTVPVSSKPASAAPGTTRPGFPAVADELARHVERLGFAKVVELLAVRPSDLPPMLEGRVAVGKAGLERLRKAG